MREDKNTAILLRKRGYSYNDISRQLSIPKSTLSGWFHGLSFSEKIKKVNISQSKRILAENITRYNKERSKIARERWIITREGSKKDIVNLSDKELLLVGTALYWAEGYKKTNWNLSFANSDPEMIKIIMKFFRNICHVPEGKFRVQMQLYPKILSDDAKKYWSKITGISTDQFTKAIYQISSASKLKRGHTLPYGTIRIRINDVILVNKIKGWISGLSDSV